MSTDLVKRGDILHVPLTKLITLDGFNLPGRDQEIEELAESMYNNGVKVPLKGYKEGENYVVIVGHRRLAAGQLIKKKYRHTTIYPFVAYPKGISEKDMLLDHFLTNDGKSLTPLQTAVGVARLIEADVKPKEISKLLGFSDVYIANLQKLAAAPKEAHDLVSKGIISSTLLISQLKKNRSGDITEFIEKAIELGKRMEAEQKLILDKQEKDKEERINRKKTGKKSKGTGTKTKQSRVTNKDINQNSIKELKRFIKVTRDDMPFIVADKEPIYQFCKDLMDNKYTYDKLMKFFTNTK